MTSSTQKLGIIALAFCCLFMISCSNANSIKSSSVGSNTSIPTDSQGKALMECNRLSNDQANIHAKLKVFRNDANIINENYIRLKFTSMPSGFADGNTYIKFYRGKQNPGDSANSFNQSFYGQALSFDVERSPNDVMNLIATQIDSIHNDVASLSDRELTDVSIVLDGFSLSEGYQALEIVLYNSNSNAAVAYSIGLVPFIHADPYDYYSSHSQQGELVKLHPFWSIRNSGKSAKEFAVKAQQEFCF